MWAEQCSHYLINRISFKWTLVPAIWWINNLDRTQQKLFNVLRVYIQTHTDWNISYCNVHHENDNEVNISNKHGIRSSSFSIISSVSKDQYASGLQSSLFLGNLSTWLYWLWQVFMVPEMFVCDTKSFVCSYKVSFS